MKKNIIEILKQRVCNIVDTSENKWRVIEDSEFDDIAEDINALFAKRIVSIEFKEKCKTDIEELEQKRYILSNDKVKCYNNIDAWSDEMSFINGQIQALKSALNYC